MKKVELILVVVLFAWCSFRANADSTNVFPLFGEGNSNVVKLMWLPTFWPDSLIGFSVKRRVANNNNIGKWEQLNDKLIFPESSPDKYLGNIEKDDNELQKLHDKLQADFDKGVKTILREEFVKELVQNNKKLKALAMLCSMNFDNALLMGFAIVDRGMPKSNTYEYGLFPHYIHSVPKFPSATYKWKYGDEVHNDIVEDGVFMTSKRRILLEWGVVEDYDKKAHVRGFNVYRRKNDEKYIKLNKYPIMIGKIDTIVKYHDDDYEENTDYSYALTVFSIFNTESRMNEVQLNSSVVPANISPPVLQIEKSENINKDVMFNWEFNDTNNNYLRGFVLKQRSGGGYENVSGLIASDRRSFKYNGTWEYNKSYDYIIEYFFKDYCKDCRYRYTTRSNELNLYFYKKSDSYLSPPQNLEAKLQKNEEGSSNRFVLLSWNSASSNDLLIDGYYLYSGSANDEKLVVNSVGLINNHEYSYNVQASNKSQYVRFAVKAAGNSELHFKESEFSNIASVEIPPMPSRYIKWVDFKKVEVVGSVVSFSWDYSEYHDLAGFRIYSKDKLLVDEKVIGKDMRKWSSSMLSAGTYAFRIIAVTKTGVKSSKSRARNIEIK